MPLFTDNHSGIRLSYFNLLGFIILVSEVHNIQNDIQNICELQGVVHGFNIGHGGEDTLEAIPCILLYEFGWLLIPDRYGAEEDAVLVDISVGCVQAYSYGCLGLVLCDTVGVCLRDTVGVCLSNS